MNPVIQKLPKLNKYIEYIDDVKNDNFPIGLSGLTDAQKTHFIYSTSCYTDKPFCLITSNEMIAKNMIKDLKAITQDKIMFLGKREVVVYDYDAESRENSRNRAYVLSMLAQNKIKIIVTTIEAIMQPVIDKELYLQSIIDIKENQEIDIDKFIGILLNSGYERTQMVEAKGQFCLRGGIIDVFSNNMELPIRIELFGDDVESIRTFNIVNQRSIDSVKSVTIYPCEEYVITSTTIKNVVNKIEKMDLSKLSNKEKEKIEEDIEQLNNGNYLNKIDKYFNFFYENTYSILDYFNNKFNIFIDESDKVKQRIENINKDTDEIIKDLIEKKRYVPNTLYKLLNVDDVIYKIKNKKIIYLERLEKTNNQNIMTERRKNYSFNCREVNFFRYSMDIFIKEVKEEYEKGKAILMLFQNKVKAQNISNELNENNIQNKFYESLDFIDELEEGKIYISIGYSTIGYEYRDLKLIVISDNENEDIKKKKTYKTSTFKDSKKIVLADLYENDYVVHISHGIGQFVGIDTLDINGIKKDYVKLKYQDNDMLYIPTNQLDSIRKYIAINDGIPKINKLGTKQWEKAKKKAKESIDNIAKDLVKLYAERQQIKGFAFEKDSDWQRQFELDFPYQETKDQLRCIDEVKKDMEKDVPMDRILCGDVGYGKTEVAIRAAFKAVMNNKQVAYLVPTTILANQQYESFKNRMQDYGIKVNVLNRFRTKKEQKDIIGKLKLGQIDIIVGTHRLIQKDVGFKDLGLLIIDEEHRFGVKDKEAIKELKKSVDVLSMTATPIPRTLHMSIVGIRDMSVIYDPPHNRKPVQTYVLEYDKFVIQDAIIKELEREGQIFYLYNKVDDIEKKAIEIQNLVPDSVVEYAHGRMSGEEIENIMYDFTNKKIDILVCTTILESGIDIPNANTMIIENADRMGLAQLYQIRGRVGRKDRQAYAYITYKKNKLLSEVAEKRLKAIKEFTEFGSGFKIALRDLEIRGAGNILGSEQHGQMEAIGYEMYCRMLEDAIRELKGEKISEKIDIEIDLDISAYIPDTYISNQNQKIEVYQNIALCETMEDVEDILDEIIDRYGEIPKEVNNLLDISKIKIIARELGISSIVQKGNNIRFQISNNHNISDESFNKMIEKYRIEISIENNMIIKRLKQTDLKDSLNIVNNFLEILK